MGPNTRAAPADPTVITDPVYGAGIGANLRRL